MHFIDKLQQQTQIQNAIGFFAAILPHNNISNLATMKTILLIKEIYAEGFRNLGNFIVRKYFKLFAWFSFAMFLVVLYAFIFRLSTGFPFD